MKNYDKSLKEVWEWKESVYQDVRNLSPKEYIKKIKEDAENILSEKHIKLTSVSSKKERRKYAIDPCRVIILLLLLRVLRQSLGRKFLYAPLPAHDRASAPDVHLNAVIKRRRRVRGIGPHVCDVGGLLYFVYDPILEYLLFPLFQGALFGKRKGL